MDKCEDVTLVTWSDSSTEPFWPGYNSKLHGWSCLSAYYL